MAILDAVAQEPIRDENKLLGMDRCIITPHYAWAPTETRQRLVTTVVENVEAFIKGEIINQVNS
jgi:glycerate dehydrogenase